MRHWLVVFAACSSPQVAKQPRTAPAVAAAAQPAGQAPAITTAAQPAAAQAPAPRTPAPAIPTLSRRGELYMLIADGANARCQRWTIDPDARTLRSEHVLAGTPVVDELEYSVAGTELEIASLSRTYDDDASTSTTCGTRFEVRETDRALVVDRAHWFRTAADCAQAIANHARVATELPCDLVEDAPEHVQRATRTRFERILARGGTLYSIVDGPKGQRCKPVRVRAERPTGDSLEGNFAYAVVRDDGVKGIEELGYSYQRGDTAITLLGPGTTWEDGSGSAFG